MLLVLIAAGLAPFFLKDQNGQPLFKIDDIKIPHITIPKLPGTNSAKTPHKIQLYRWQDKSGSWQFSNTPPEGIHFEVMEVDANMNVVPAIQHKAIVEQGEAGKKNTSTDTPPDMPSPYSIDQVQRLIGDAKAISATADERQKNLDQAINGQ